MPASSGPPGATSSRAIILKTRVDVAVSGRHENRIANVRPVSGKPRRITTVVAGASSL